MQTSIALIGDFCEVYRKEMIELINIEIIKSIIELMKEYKMNKKLKELIRHSEQVDIFIILKFRKSIQ